MFFVWPFIQGGIYALGDLVLRSGYAGTLIYGFIERILIPFGLHHVFYLPFWQTGLGGTAVIDGVTVMGAQNIFFAELASPATEVFSVEATRFICGSSTATVRSIGSTTSISLPFPPATCRLPGGVTADFCAHGSVCAPCYRP